MMMHWLGLAWVRGGAVALLIALFGAGPALALDRAVLPLTQDSEGRATVAVALNDAGPFQLVVDTGATRTVIAPGVMAALGLTAGPPIAVRGIGGLGSALSVSMQRMSAVGFDRAPVSAAVIGGGMLSGSDGLLGMDLFRDGHLTLDFANGQMILARFLPQSQRDRLMTVSGVFVQGTLLVIRTEISGVTALALVDTGASHTMINLALLRALGLDPLAQTQGRVDEATPGIGQGPRPGVAPLLAVQMPLVRVGDLEVTGLTAYAGDLEAFSLWAGPQEPAMVLGMDVWNRLSALSIDFRRAELQMRLPPRTGVGRAVAGRRSIRD